MKIGLLGLPGSGKSTCFRAVTGKAQEGRHGDDIAVVEVPDDRLPRIAGIYGSEKMTPPELVVVDLTALSKGEDVGNRQSHLSNAAGDADAFALVIQAFGTINHLGGELDPKSDLEDLLLELCLTDLDVISGRLKRLEDSSVAKRDRSQFEVNTLQKCYQHLEQGALMLQLKLEPEAEKLLRGFGLLTMRPMLVVFNVGEEDLAGARIAAAREYADIRGLPSLVFCAELEEEILQLAPAEQEEFLADYGLDGSARDRLIKAAYDALDIITFYTSAGTEARAWTVRAGTTAHEAAGKIHTDMAEKFVRAERIAGEALCEAGSEAEAKKRGDWSLEGTDYIVQDGDLLLIRFTH
jgi:ribosome-binding ATPase